METTSMVDEQGRVTIPPEILEEAGFGVPSKAVFSIEDGKVILQRVRRPDELVGFLGTDEDDDGPSGTEMLRTDRERDKQELEDLINRYSDEESE